jgi:recombination DNA repair RAD52 pathway protein
MSLELWNKVEKTNPLYVKKVNQRGGFSAIDAHSQIKAATEAFGPVGIGWGYDCKYIFLDRMVVCEVTLWHGARENKFGPVGGAAELKDKGFTEAPKSAMTDGLTKALSHLGFNADVFLGKFDDNKYVQEVTKEFKDKEPKKEYTQAMFDDQKMGMVKMVKDKTRTPKIIIDNLEKGYIVSDSIKKIIEGIK